MSVLGVVFAVLIAIGLFRRPFFPWVLALSAAFPYSAAITVAGNSVTPFHLCALTATMLLFFEPRRPSAKLSRPGAVALTIFVTWSLFITLIAPIMFAGEAVLNSRTGLDNAVEAPEPLVYTISTVAQAGYLVITIGAVLYLARRTPTPALALVPFIVATILGAINSVFLTVGLPWPSGLFDTSLNTIYSTRPRGGVFNEPSEFGGFSVAALALFTVAAVRVSGRLRAASIALAGLAAFNLVTSQSGTALAGLAIIALLGLATMLVRFLFSGRGALIVIFGFGAGAIALLLFGDAIIGWGQTIFQGKIGSTSLNVRSSSDDFSLELAARTWGLGVGLGANRSSSFATMLISCVGVIGAAAFAVFLARVLPRAARVPLGATAVWGLLGFLAAKVVSLPDLTAPAMWVLIAVCVQIAWFQPEPTATQDDVPAEWPEMGYAHGVQ